MKKYKKLLGVMGGVVVQLSIGSSALALSLSEVVEQTLSTNPDVLVAQKQAESRQGEVRGARAAYLPTIDAELGIGHEWTKSPATNDEGVDLTRKEAALRLRQLLFAGGSVSGEVRRQKARYLSAQLEVLSVEENTALKATEAYIDVMRQSELLTLLKDSLDEHQNIYDQMSLRSNAGVGSKSDLDQIAARLALAKSNTVAGENNLREAVSHFHGVVGYLPEVSTLVLPEITGAPENLEAALEKAYKDHPELQVADADIAAAEAQHKTGKGAYFPQITLEGDRTWNEDIDGIEGVNEDFVIALRLRYNLYNGGGDKARRKQTASLLDESLQVRNSTHRQVEESIRLSWHAWESTNQQLSLLETYVDTVIATKSAYQKQFNIGRRSLLDLLNTENELVEARSNYLNTKYDQIFASYRMAHAQGELTHQLGIKQSY